MMYNPSTSDIDASNDPERVKFEETLSMNKDKTEEDKRNGITDPAKMWDGGIIPYDMSHLYRKDRKLYEVVRHDIKSLNKMLRGCIRFRKARSSDPLIGCYQIL